MPPKKKAGRGGKKDDSDDDQPRGAAGRRGGNKDDELLAAAAKLSLNDDSDDDTPAPAKAGGGGKKAGGGFAALGPVGGDSDEESGGGKKGGGKKKGGGGGGGDGQKPAAAAAAADGDDADADGDDAAADGGGAPAAAGGGGGKKGKNKAARGGKKAGKGGKGAAATTTTTTTTKAPARLREDDEKGDDDGDDDGYVDEDELPLEEPPWYVRLGSVYKNASRDLKFENVVLEVPGQKLLENATLTLSFGGKYGLVGRNGAGKSTLLNAVSHRTLPVPERFKIHHVEQEIKGADTTPLEAVLAADEERSWLLAVLPVVTAEEKGDVKRTVRRPYDLRQVYERLREIEADKAEPRAMAILVGLGFIEADVRVKKTREYSGGWRMRISLARALFAQPDLLLLDEPTNHLDLDACIWLEDYLEHWKNTLILVSHERTFLNNTCDHIVLIKHKALTTYKGDFDSYIKQRAINERTKSKKEDKEEKNRKRLVEIAQRDRGKATAAQAGRRIREIDRANVGKEKLRDEKNLSFEFLTPEPITGTLLGFKDVSFGYSKDRILFRDLDFGIHLNTRVALVGPNGVGKSTLLNLMAGDITPLAGEVTRSRKLRIARFTQHHVDLLNLEQTPLQFLQTKHPDVPSEQELFNHLGGFGLGGKLSRTKIRDLSGGQKSRVVFADLGWAQPHLLLLDEPSNHLDTETIDSLCESLNEFKGGVVIVSHNQQLVSAVAEELWVVARDGTVRPFDGDFEDYKSFVLQNSALIGNGEASRNTTADA